MNLNISFLITQSNTIVLVRFNRNQFYVKIEKKGVFENMYKLALRSTTAKVYIYIFSVSHFNLMKPGKLHLLHFW